MTGRRVRVRIGRLALPRHLARDAGAIESALRGEIAGALRDAGANRLHSRSVGTVDGGTVDSRSPRSVGSHIGELVAKRTLT